MYLVIECCDREISDVKPAKDQAEAVKLANGLLEDHLEIIGYDKDEPDGESLQRADPAGGEQGAWCNLKDMKYDAFCVALGSDGADAALDILLKELCKKTMEKPGSPCGDGECEECPVTGSLQLILDTSGSMG